MDVPGRVDEARAIETWLDADVSGPCMGVLGGDVGVGKSTLWSAALAAANERSFQVLSCRSDLSETGLSYVGLGDLFAGLEGSAAVRGLREPLRGVLAGTLWWEQAPGVPPHQRAVALAVLDLIRNLSAEGPVLIALDDLQWLDSATEVVLTFVLRRLTVEPVKLLVTLGAGTEGDAWPTLVRVLPPERVTCWEVGPLAPLALAAVVESRYGTAFPRPLLRWLHRACGGNPLFGLETARAWSERSYPSGDLPLPESLRHLLRGRVRALPPAAAEAVLLVACAETPTIALVRTVTGSLTGLAEAINRRLVVLEHESLGFRDPLFRNVVFEVAGPLRRREMHQRLARVVTDVEERARHLAATAGRTDPVVADTLAAAAALTAARGDPLTAGDMTAHAARLTSPGERELGLRRWRDAAGHLISGGDGSRALVVLEDALRRCPPGPVRAEMLLLLGQAAFGSGDVPGSITRLERGRAEAAGRPDLLIPITAGLTYYCVHRGDLAAAQGHARELLRLTEAAGNEDARGEAVAVLSAIELMRGAPPPAAMPAPRCHNPVDRRPLVGPHLYGFLCRCLGDLPEARAVFAALRTAAVETGTVACADWGMAWAAEVECLAGDLRAAARYADLAARAVEATGVPTSAALFAEALLLAMHGELGRARLLAAEGLRIAKASGNRLAALSVRALLGFVDLSDGDPMSAVRHLDAVEQTSRSLGVVPDVVCPTAGADHVEALVQVGQYEQAAERVERIQRHLRVVDRPLGRGLAARAHGVLLTATGSPKRGAAELEAAVAEFSAAGMPFELGRTLLALSRSQSRLRRREAARRTMERASRVFTKIGAEWWAGRGEPRPRLSAPDRLTVSEAQVVALAAEGRTNQEIAKELAIGVKTVESHLSSVYRKLGVRSRTELALRVSTGRRTPG
ncbi:helix-turn-helix transcriptional regulator [Microbispora amethystogenes]|uniref:Transcriptional regulator n=1 Tax=Microbispora amethystogenes TaxID=1427754 RepID=A0ABQ4F552_9ACTN|nr:LuxR family transcriptional regulator [Microbispora amethystogenes]GIH29940.1 transcriptional regulator [Microbispora amethystogenes]